MKVSLKRVTHRIGQVLAQAVLTASLLPVQLTINLILEVKLLVKISSAAILQ